nr:unnamed protein product [Digitaria exilis]
MPFTLFVFSLLLAGVVGAAPCCYCCSAPRALLLPPSHALRGPPATAAPLPSPKPPAGAGFHVKCSHDAQTKQDEHRPLAVSIWSFEICKDSSKDPFDSITCEKPFVRIRIGLQDSKLLEVLHRLLQLRLHLLLHRSTVDLDDAIGVRPTATEERVRTDGPGHGTPDLAAPEAMARRSSAVDKVKAPREMGEGE